MGLNRILLIVAVACFLLVAFSAFSDDVNVTETGFLALGLAAFAGSYLVYGTVGSGLGRQRVAAGRRPGWRDDPYA